MKILTIFTPMGSSTAKPAQPRSNVALLGLLVLLLWCGAFLWPRYIEPRILTMAVSMWPPAETLILAKQANEFTSNEVKFVEINWPSAAMRALGNRVADVAMLSLDEVIRQKALGYPLKVILVTDISMGADALMVRPEIRELNQLKGRKIGVEPRTAGVWLLDHALESAGLSINDIELIPMNSAESQDILSELMLDAVIVSEPWRTRVERLGLVPLFDSGRPKSDVVRVLVIHEEALEQYRSVVEKIVASHLKWAALLPGESSETLQPLLRREGLTEEEFRKTFKYIQCPGLAQNLAWLTGKDSMLKLRLQEIVKELRELDLKNPEVDLTDILDPSVLESLP